MAEMVRQWMVRSKMGRGRGVECKMVVMGTNIIHICARSLQGISTFTEAQSTVSVSGLLLLEVWLQLHVYRWRSIVSDNFPHRALRVSRCTSSTMDLEMSLWVLHPHFQLTCYGLFKHITWTEQ